MTRHVKATDAFPPELVKEMYRHYAGGYIWLPIPRRQINSVKSQVLTYREMGYATNVIADLVKRTPRRVCQIIKAFHGKKIVGKKIGTEVLQKAAEAEARAWAPGQLPIAMDDKRFGEAMRNMSVPRRDSKV